MAMTAIGDDSVPLGCVGNATVQSARELSMKFQSIQAKIRVRQKGTAPSQVKDECHK